MSRWFPSCLYVSQLGLRNAMCISKQSAISYSHRLPFFLCFPYFILGPSSFNFQIVTFHCLKILQSLWVLTTSLHSFPRYFYVLFFLLQTPPYSYPYSHPPYFSPTYDLSDEILSTHHAMLAFCPPALTQACRNKGP